MFDISWAPDLWMAEAEVAPNDTRTISSDVGAPTIPLSGSIQRRGELTKVAPHRSYVPFANPFHGGVCRGAARGKVSRGGHRGGGRSTTRGKENVGDRHGKGMAGDKGEVADKRLTSGG